MQEEHDRWRVRRFRCIRVSRRVTTHPSLLSRDLSGLPDGLSRGVFLDPGKFLDPDLVSPGVFLYGEEGERE